MDRAMRKIAQDMEESLLRFQRAWNATESTIKGPTRDKFDRGYATPLLSDAHRAVTACEEAAGSISSIKSQLGMR